MNLIVVTPPAVEPVTLAEVYLHLRLDPDTDSPPTHPDDAMLRSQIATARAEAEAYTKRAFVEQTLRLFVSRFPCNEAFVGGESWFRLAGGRGYIELLRPPLMAVQSVRYYDQDNTLQTVSPADYFVTDDFVPRLTFVDTFVPPLTYVRNDAVRVDYVAGYVSDDSPADDPAENVPDQIKQAILLGVQLLYDQLSPDQRKAIENARDMLLIGQRVTTV